MRNIWLLLFITWLCTGFTPASAEQRSPVKVTVSIEPHRVLVEQIGGEHVQSMVLVPAGADPHLYQPLPRQLSFLSESDLVFFVGMPFEKLLLNRFKQHLQGHMIDLTEKMPSALAPANHHSHCHACCSHDSDRDPHTWVDPLLLIEQARLIKEALCEIRPTLANDFRSSYERLHVKLTELDEACADLLAPHAGKSVLVYHPGWHYFLTRYGMHQVAIEREGKPLAARHIAELIASMDSHFLNILVVQPQFDSRATQNIAQHLGVSVTEVDNLHPDFLEELRRLAEILSTAAALPSSNAN